MWTPDRSTDIVTAEQRHADAIQAALATLRNLETNEPVPQAWLDYRHALRGLPETTTDPANSDWPEAPAYFSERRR